VVNLTLTNQNPRAQENNNQQVIINFSTKRCKFSNQKDISIKQLLKDSNFNHPLLLEPIPHPQKNKAMYCYEYDDIDGLLYSAIFVYSALLHAKTPSTCKFKITPSATFQRTITKENIDFSIRANKKAQETVNMQQLAGIVKALRNHSFNFSNELIIEDEFTYEWLPEAVDGDTLYQSEQDIVTLLKTPQNTSRFELRYISSDIGLGVYAKTTIAPDEVIGIYTGKKAIQFTNTFAYRFLCYCDCLGMDLDAYHSGNITRFINHAPEDNTREVNTLRIAPLEANIKANTPILSGIGLIVYTATKTILPGEQLLVDYGSKYFKHAPQTHFNAEGHLIDTDNKLLSKYKRKYHRKKWNIVPIRIMANHGVKSAQTYLLLRISTIALIITALTFGLNWGL
jgi:hypothetical protein